MSDSEEFEFGDEVPINVKSDNQQPSPCSEEIPVNVTKIPKKRSLPAPEVELSDGEIESPTPPSDESDYEDLGDDESAPRDHTLKKMDSKLESDDFEVSLSSLAKTKKEIISKKKKKKVSTKKSADKVAEKKKRKIKNSLNLKTPSKKSKSLTSTSKLSGKKTPQSSKKKKLLKKCDLSPSTKSSSSTLVTASSELYSKCSKGKVIKQLLCRWWYATEWPEPKSLPEKPPENYDSLDGFPGVYICTSGDKVGHILDVRDKDTCPNFKNYAQKPARELIEMLIKAILKQKDILIELEGSDTQTEKDLVDLYKWALKLKPEKVDSDAMKVTKAYHATIK